jgi:hypothetical protein
MRKSAKLLAFIALLAALVVLAVVGGGQFGGIGPDGGAVAPASGSAGSAPAASGSAAPARAANPSQLTEVEASRLPDRGARRIVAGSSGEKYYTADHYSSFRFIIEGK